MIPTAIIIVVSEIIRSIFLAEKSKISKVLTTIAMILIDLTLYMNVNQLTTYSSFVNIISFSLLTIFLIIEVFVLNFSTKDLLLLRGTPQDRRDWLDRAISQVYPAYDERLSKYDKIPGFSSVLPQPIKFFSTKITLSKELGQKELAYEINKHKTGYYYLYNIEVEDDNCVKEFDRVANIKETVTWIRIRYEQDDLFILVF